MKITVTTPTGHIGSKLSNLLLDRGAEVTVIARDPAKVKDLAGRGAHVVAGEHSDPAVVKRAIEGADSLFWLNPPNYTTKDPGESTANLPMRQRRPFRSFRRSNWYCSPA